MTSRLLLSSVQKAFQVLEYISKKKDGVGVTELSHALGYSKSTAHRLCATLLDCGYLEQVSNSVYIVTAKMFEVGSEIIHSTDFYALSFSYLESLRDRFNETAHMAIFNVDHIVFVNKVESQRSIILSSKVGGEGPAHATAIGKVLLAHLSDPEIEKFLREKSLKKYTKATITNPKQLREKLRIIKEQGYAINEGEYETGVNCVAAPIKDHAGHTVAAISVSIPKWRTPPKEEVIREVLKVSVNFSKQLGFYGSKHIISQPTEK